MAATTKDRSRQTVRDLVLSMAVVGIFVAFLYLVVLRPTPDPVKVVDVTGPATVAQQAGAFPILIPTALPSGWRATSARYTPGSEDGTANWYNGYLNPDGKFVAVVQQDFDTKKFISDTTGGATSEGTVTLDGVTWEKYYDAGKGEWLLVDQGPEVTTIVTGQVPYDQLSAFALKLNRA